MQKEKSQLALQAFNVVACVDALEKEGFTVQAINVTESFSQVLLKYQPAVKRLHGIDRGVIGGKGGRYLMKQIKLCGVHVQWLVPYFDAQQSAKEVH